MVDLASYNTFGIHASAEALLTIANEQKLVEYVNVLHKTHRPYFVLGGGANVLFVADFAGDILHVTNQDLEVISEDAQQVLVRVGAGYEWDAFVAWSVAKGYWGVELLSGIPGTVGASPVQNIGAYGAEAAEVIAEVEAVEIATGVLVRFDVADLALGYRTSRFKREWKGCYVIHHVTYRLAKNALSLAKYERLGLQKNRFSLQEVRDRVLSIRASKLPSTKDIGSAGSFFKNPEVEQSVLKQLRSTYENMPYYATERSDMYKLSAGWLIEQCGWKGYRVGDAGVYEKQALVLVNYGSATGREILVLSEQIADDVYKKMGVRLEREVEIVPAKY